MPTTLFSSKIPNVSTTIFSVMSNLANKHEAINLSQGFPNFPSSPELISLVDKYMKKGFNQYAPMSGIIELRAAISNKIYNVQNINYNPETEITVTSGGTEALFAAISSVVKPNDEVIIFEPAYDSYAPVIELNGGKPIYITLAPPIFKINWQEVKSKINEKTSLIIINTPHNPTGTILSKEDLTQLAEIIKDSNIFILSDEVYEHIVFDGKNHNSMMLNPILKNRTFICGSFGKTFHVTGWKLGYCLAPEYMTNEFRKIHQYLTFCTFTPAQYAIAEYLNNPLHYLSLASFYEGKRNKFIESISNSKFTFELSQGTYFQNLSYKNISDENDFDLAVRLTKEIGVASIPISVFYNQKNDYKLLRFCFAKDDETLEKAGEQLSKL